MTKMAHELEMNIDGTARMFSVQKTPWHKLGVILPEAPTAEQAIMAAGLDWTVSKRQVYFQQKIDGQMQVAKDQFAVVRDQDERHFGGAGNTWQPLQNAQAFSFFDPFIESGEASFETAGSLDQGKRIWVLAKIKRDPIEVVKGDTIDKYILLSNRHTAGYAVVGALTPIRVVCANTEAMALNTTRKMFKSTHSQKMHERLAEVQVQISYADQAFEKTAEYYRAFARKQITQKELENFTNAVFGYADVVKKGREEAFKQKQHETIQRLFETGRGSDIKGVRGTVWGAYNTVTEFIQHEMGSKVTIDDKRLETAWFGNGMNLNVHAFNVAKDMVSA